MRVLLILLISLLLCGCSVEFISDASEKSKTIYSIKVYSNDAQVISEYRTYTNPFTGYRNTCALEHTTIKFITIDGKEIVIVNGIIVIEEELHPSERRMVK